jgi:hypothetical protein
MCWRCCVALQKGVVEVRLRRSSWREEQAGYCELATGAWPLVGGDCACCSTHLILEVLTLGVVGMGMARTNCRLSGLFRSE